MRPGQVRSALHTLLTAPVPTPAMVWGPPGVGKSDIARQVADELQLQYIDVRALILDPVDLRGVPSIADGRTRWCPPEFLPPTDSGDGFLINLEELPAAPQIVQAALYQLVLDRQIGEYRLPPGARIIACGNRITDRGVSHRMPTPLASRFVHLEMKTEVADWMDWATRSGIAPEIIFFLRFRPQLLHAFDPRSEEHAFASPRTWAFASRIIDSAESNGGVDPGVLRSMLRGTIGEGATVEFLAYREMMSKLVSPELILKTASGPDTYTVPRNPSTELALCGYLARAVDADTFGNLLRFSKRLRAEIREFLVNTTIRRHPSLRETEAFVHWVAGTASSYA